MLEDRTGKPLSERLGESPRAAGWARIATWTQGLFGSAAFGIIVWGALHVMQKTDENNVAINRIDNFISAAEERGKAKETRIGSLEQFREDQRKFNADITGQIIRLQSVHAP